LLSGWTCNFTVFFSNSFRASLYLFGNVLLLFHFLQASLVENATDWYFRLRWLTNGTATAQQQWQLGAHARKMGRAEGPDFGHVYGFLNSYNLQQILHLRFSGLHSTYGHYGTLS